MPRWSFLLAVLPLFVGPVYSQPRPLQLGLSAGPAAVTQTHHASEDLQARYGAFETAYLISPAASLFFIKPLSDRVAVRGGIGVMRKGHRRKGRSRPDITEVIRLDVFSFQLGGEVGMPLGGGVWGYGTLNSRLDVLFGEESEFVIGGEGQGGRPTRLRYNLLVFGGVLGLGIRFDAGIGKALQLEGRVDQDVTPAYSNDELTVRGRAFVISAGILF